MLTINDINEDRLVSIIMTDAEYIIDRNELSTSDMANFLLYDFEEDCSRVLSFLSRIGNEDTDIYKVVQKLSKDTENIDSFDSLHVELVNAVKLAKLDKLL